MAKSKSSAASENERNKSADSKFLDAAMQIVKENRKMFEQVGRL